MVKAFISAFIVLSAVCAQAIGPQRDAHLILTKSLGSLVDESYGFVEGRRRRGTSTSQEYNDFGSVFRVLGLLNWYPVAVAYGVQQIFTPERLITIDCDDRLVSALYKLRRVLAFQGLSFAMTREDVAQYRSNPGLRAFRSVEEMDEFAKHPELAVQLQIQGVFTAFELMNASENDLDDFGLSEAEFELALQVRREIREDFEKPHLRAVQCGAAFMRP